MPLTVRLNAADLDADRLQQLALDLCGTINAETDVTARLSEDTGIGGAKGDPITVGAIVLALVTSGAAAKLFDVFRTYFERKSSLEIVLQRDDGERMTVRAENVAADRVAETIALARHFIGTDE